MTAEEPHKHFDRSDADIDGRTSVGDRYVASPAEEAARQAIITAGWGVRVGRPLIGETRHDRGSPATVADYDWLRRKTERNDALSTRERWHEWVAARVPDHLTPDEDRRVDLRETEIDRRCAAYFSAEAIDQRDERGRNRLLEHIDDDWIPARAREIETERQSTMGGAD